MSKNDISMRYCSLFLLIEVLFFLFQLSNGILDVWNLIPTCIILFIFFRIVFLTSGSSKRQTKKLFLSKFKKQEKNDKLENKVDKPKSKAKPLILKILFLIILIFFEGGMIFNYYDCITDPSFEDVVNATIETQYVYEEYEYDYDDDSYTVKIYNTLTLSYTYEGKEFKQEKTIKSGKLYLSTIDISVNEDGYILNLGNIKKTYFIVSIIGFCFLVILFINIIKKLPLEGLVFIIMGVLGSAFLVLINHRALLNFMFSSVSTVCISFISIALYGITYSFFVQKE